MKEDFGRQAIIDFDLLDENIELVKKNIINNAGIIAVLKGDAYGHGLRAMAKEISKNRNVSMLAVSSLEEARAICDTNKDILILYPVVFFTIRKMANDKCNTEKNRDALKNKFIFSISNMNEYEMFCELSKETGICFRVHLRLDFQSGVKGFTKKDYLNIKDRIFEEKGINVCGIYAHLCSAYSDDYACTQKELEEYDEVFADIPSKIRKRLMVHLLTSASFERFKDYQYDAVRVGTVLYGLPSNAPSDKDRKCIMKIYANIVNIVDVANASSVDYSGALDKSIKRVALVPVGRWDIPHFFLGEKCSVKVAGHLTKVAGSPCMDTCCIDVTGLMDVKVGDEVYFLDNESEISFDDKIKENHFDVTSCEMIFAGISRLPKIYIRSEN